ncbi:MAG TPA: hypothetical protein VFQ00_06010 [Terriglobales bacterium]|nr:hypothetical protein [Terriglobales bacterium]
MKVARGTDEYLARFVGWESRAGGQEQVALFALRDGQGEQLRRLIFPETEKIDDKQRLKTLFTLIFSARASGEEWTPTSEELELVQQT